MDRGTEIADAMGGLRRERPFAVTTTEEGRQRIYGVVTPEQVQRIIRRTMQLGSEGGPAPPRTDQDTDVHLPEGDRR